MCSVYVHRLKAYLLFGEKIFEKDIQVRHLDGDSMNFKDSNILLGTPSENSLDRSKELRVSSAKNAAKKLRRFTEGEVEEIRKINKYTGGSRIAHAYKCAKSTISYIINNKTYTAV